MPTDISYEEMTDEYHGVCLAPECGWTGPGRMHLRDADRDADHHEDRHEEVI